MPLLFVWINLKKWQKKIYKGDDLTKKKQDGKRNGSKYEKWDKGQDKAEEETK